jgi:hypothetical protein
VLLLYSEPRLTPAIVTLDQGIRSTIEARSPIPVYFYTEFLDLNLFDGPVPQREMRELLRRKYQARPIDLIVAAGRALRVALHNRADLFSGAPVVFVAADRAGAADLKLEADVTGTWLHQPWTETLDLARLLQPETRRAVVVGGSSPTDGLAGVAPPCSSQVIRTIAISYHAGLRPRISSGDRGSPDADSRPCQAVPARRHRRDFTHQVARRIVASRVPVLGSGRIASGRKERGQSCGEL